MPHTLLALRKGFDEDVLLPLNRSEQQGMKLVGNAMMTASAGVIQHFVKFSVDDSRHIHRSHPD
jgi:hypothetical protein